MHDRLHLLSVDSFRALAIFLTKIIFFDEDGSISAVFCLKSTRTEDRNVYLQGRVPRLDDMDPVVFRDFEGFQIFSGLKFAQTAQHLGPKSAGCLLSVEID
jgi:hypothetical protein